MQLSLSTSIVWIQLTNPLCTKSKHKFASNAKIPKQYLTLEKIQFFYFNPSGFSACSTSV